MCAAILPILFAQQGNGPPLALIFWAVVILIFIVRNLFRFSAGLIEAINTVRHWLGKEPLGQKFPRLARSHRQEKRLEEYADLEEADPLENMEPLEHFDQAAPVPPKTEDERLREEIRRFQLNRRAPQPPTFESPVYQPPVNANQPTLQDIPRPILARSDNITSIDNIPPADTPANAQYGAFSSAALAESLANLNDLRKAILLSEILRRPNWEPAHTTRFFP